MANRELCIKIAGEAGQGINVSALTFARACTRAGLHAFLLTDNPNSIKLEPAWCSVRVSETPVYCQSNRVDVLVALSKDALLRHHADVDSGGCVLYDSEVAAFDPALARKDIQYHAIPLEKLIAELGVPVLLRNTVAVGAMLALLCYPLAPVQSLLEEQFTRKGAETVSQNIRALEAGNTYVREHLSFLCKQLLVASDKTPRMFINGNEALSVGALKAGMKFLSAYPMTPASGVLHYVASKEKEYGVVVKHTEDEISAALMAIGASFTGVRAMTCTSGGGFCLMTEALGFAAQSETPMVVILGQRPGPSTGQPTHTAQGDLLFALHASQGEFPRFIIAPGDPQECFLEGFRAFDLAERFQVPVIVMTDKYLGESYWSIPGFDTATSAVDRGACLPEHDVTGPAGYKRYALTADGISARAFPGARNGIHLATSYEHDESGYYTEDPLMLQRMIDKKFAKVAAMQKASPMPQVFGPADAQVTLVSWGSNKGPILEALELLRNDGIRANFLHLVYLWPFPVVEVARILGSSQRSVLVELNKTAQLGRLIAQETAHVFSQQILKYNGLPFYPGEIAAAVKEGMR